MLVRSIIDKPDTLDLNGVNAARSGEVPTSAFGWRRWAGLGHSAAERCMAEKGGQRPPRSVWPMRPSRALEVVNNCLKSRHSEIAPGCRWQPDGLWSIVVQVELPLLGEGHRMNVAEWLKGLGLERYEPLFRDNEIDWEVLPNLTSEDLREIGVVAIGNGRRLLDAITALGDGVSTSTAGRRSVSHPTNRHAVGAFEFS